MEEEGLSPEEMLADHDMTPEEWAEFLAWGEAIDRALKKTRRK